MGSKMTDPLAIPGALGTFTLARSVSLWPGFDLSDRPIAALTARRVFLTLDSRTNVWGQHMLFVLVDSMLGWVYGGAIEDIG